MFRFEQRFKSSKIDGARTRSAVITAGKMHVVDVEAAQSVLEGFQMHQMGNKAEVFLDLCVAGIVPINEARASQFTK